LIHKHLDSDGYILESVTRARPTCSTPLELTPSDIE
jgi:hypothetical protein